MLVICSHDLYVYLLCVTVRIGFVCYMFGNVLDFSFRGLVGPLMVNYIFSAVSLYKLNCFIFFIKAFHLYFRMFSADVY